MKKRTAILGIDIQNDFSSPSGSLFVRGADLDAVRIATFIDKYEAAIDYIALTLDTHQPIHIATQNYWKDIEGYPPPLYFTITASDVRDNIWIPQYNKEEALPYLEELEKQGNMCTIWPTHCVMGSSGWAINSMLMNAIFTWSINTKKMYELYFKGMEENTEHYSIFKPMVLFKPESYYAKQNKKLLSKLEEFDRILIMGEAADFCVASTLNDMLDMAPHLAQKLFMMKDCMSWIMPNNERVQLMFEIARKRGVRFITTNDFESLL